MSGPRLWRLQLMDAVRTRGGGGFYSPCAAPSLRAIARTDTRGRTTTWHAPVALLVGACRHTAAGPGESRVGLLAARSRQHAGLADKGLRS